MTALSYSSNKIANSCGASLAGIEVSSTEAGV
jgi:hypothetical protein